MGDGSAGGLLHLPRRVFLRVVVGHYFHRYFDAVPAVTPELREAAYRIRYEVYCSELGWEDKTSFPDGMETDEYDEDSSLVLLHHRPGGVYAGCVRLVRTPPGNPDKPLPFELGCADTLYDEARELLASGRMNTGEISRLAVTPRFRRRMGEKPPVGDASGGAGGKHHRRTPPIAMSLYVAAACAGLEAGLDSVFALMEPRLASRLTHYGIRFQKMGDAIEHRGLRAPFYITRKMLFEGIDPKVQALLDVITDDLRKGPRRS